jgi:hypothetical protein
MPAILNAVTSNPENLMRASLAGGADGAEATALTSANQFCRQQASVLLGMA